MSRKLKALKLSSSSVPTISKEMSLCLRNGIKVYPVNVKSKWFIEVNNNNKITRFEKEVLKNEISLSMAKTYIYYYEKLKNVKNGK